MKRFIILFLFSFMCSGVIYQGVEATELRNLILTGTDYINGQSGIDSTTEAINIIEYSHHKIHSGSHFYFASSATVANGDNLDFLWDVDDTTKWPHALWGLEASVEMTFTLYEDVITSASGASVVIHNNNRNSLKTPFVMGFTGPTLNSGVLGDGIEGGKRLWQAKVGSGKKIGGEASRGHEFVGKQGAKYWFRINNASGGAGWLNYDFNWYETTDKN